MLPTIPHITRTSRQSQNAFGGLDRRAASGNGAIVGMENLWSGDAPLLSSRPPRRYGNVMTQPRGIFHCGGSVYTADGTTLYRDGVNIGTVSNTDKVWAALGERVIIFPDKLLWDGTTLKPLESSATVSATFTDGTYAGEAAAGNTIEAASLLWDWSDYFAVGDAVTISGAADAENNKTIIVREIDGNKLRFYENSFTVNETAASITVARTVPDMDYIFTIDNRVWGCKGDTIYCSKLGDPANWNVFDGVSTDAWSVDTGTAGQFTAATAFMGYPCFFKRDRIFKVYGNRPTNFETMSAPTLGVLDGRSLAVANETLFYLSPAGFCAYTGGVPSPVGQALNTQYYAAVGGTDGLKYYVSAYTGTAWELLVYDPGKGMWHREDDTHARFSDGVTFVRVDGQVMELGEASDGSETVTSSVTFGDWDYQTFDSKYPVRLWLRAKASGTLTVKIRYDGGAWETAATLTGGAKQSYYFPLPIRRCDHYALKIEAAGALRLYALEHEFYAGTTSRRG